MTAYRLVAEPRADLDIAAAAREEQPRGAAEKGEARQFLFPFHRLQQEAVPSVVELEERTHRRFQISQQLPIDRDHVSLAGELPKFSFRWPDLHHIAR